VKTKPLTKKQVKEKWQHHSYKELKEIALEILKGVAKEQLMPTLLKLQQSTKPVVMGNLSVIDDNPMSRESLTKGTIARIRTTSTMDRLWAMLQAGASQDDEGAGFRGARA